MLCSIYYEACTDRDTLKREEGFSVCSSCRNWNGFKYIRKGNCCFFQLNSTETPSSSYSKVMFTCRTWIVSPLHLYFLPFYSPRSGQSANDVGICQLSSQPPPMLCVSPKESWWRSLIKRVKTSVNNFSLASNLVNGKHWLKVSWLCDEWHIQLHSEFRFFSCFIWVFYVLNVQQSLFWRG